MTRSTKSALYINDPNVGLALTMDDGRFKMDGLFVTLAFKDKDFTDNIIYENLLTSVAPTRKPLLPSP